MTKTVQYKLNLPADIDEWIEAQTKQSLRTKPAEVILAIKEKMQREAKANP